MARAHALLALVYIAIAPSVSHPFRRNIVSSDYSEREWDTEWNPKTGNDYLDPRYDSSFGFSASPAEWKPATMECNLGRLPSDFFAAAQDQIRMGIPVARSYFFSKHGYEQGFIFHMPALLLPPPPLIDY